MTITIAIDAMGGDHGCYTTVPAALSFLQAYPEVNLILVGIPAAIEAALQQAKCEPPINLRIHAATEVIAMDESPAIALRSKKDSSMRVAINLVKEQHAQACVSAGNTGALMAISRFVLKMLDGIDRPAIAKLLPTVRGTTCMLDLGANVDCEAIHLLQFAAMGSILMSSAYEKANPTVGLLNVGSEDIKGNEISKQTYKLLQKSQLNFYGNIEGDDIYHGTTDVIVCDGFVGNVALKTSEGLSHMLKTMIREEFTRSLGSKLIGLLAKPVLNRIAKRVDTRRYNGASLLGLRGVVIKSHGGADVYSFHCALENALREAQGNIIHRLEKSLPALLASSTEA